MLIKVPGTAGGRRGLRGAHRAGVNVNVTLLFDGQALRGDRRGLRARARAPRRRTGEPIDRVASVASFFVSPRGLARSTRRSSELGRDRPPGQGGRRQRHDRLRVVPAHLLRRALGDAEGEGRQRAAAAVGLDLDQEPRLPGHALRGQADRARHGQHDARRRPSRPRATTPRAERTIDRDLDGRARADATSSKASASTSTTSSARQLVDEGVASFAKSFDSLIETIAGKLEGLRRGGELSAAAGDVRREGLLALTEHDAVRRLFARDASLWPGGQAGAWLGWLDAPKEHLEVAGDLETWAAEAVSGVRHVVLCGMGGSSLAPIVFRELFGLDRLHVLDSTDPDAVRALPTQDSLYVISSKSGSTIEPPGVPRDVLACRRRRRVALRGDHRPGQQAAPAGRGRGVAHAAAGQARRRRPLLGADVLRAGAGRARRRPGARDARGRRGDARGLRARRRAGAQPGRVAGRAVGAGARAGRDKLTIVASPGLESFGLWLEQLVAESTGKQGRGIVPVAGEPVGEPEAYGDDRAVRLPARRRHARRRARARWPRPGTRC